MNAKHYRFKTAVTDLFQSLPVGVGFREVGQLDDSVLFPEERRMISERAVQKRKIDFALGRAAAREALRALSHTPVPILRGSRGEPIWPPGVVGSITHSCGVAVALAGKTSEYLTIGIDLESATSSLSLRSMKTICVEEEAEWVLASGATEANIRLIRLFSAKEAIFKALYPLVRTELMFKDALLRWDGDIADGIGGFIANVRNWENESAFCVHSVLFDAFVFSWLCIQSNYKSSGNMSSP
jgi:Phosphopantetheinyl transferase component of siderophore synthetase